MALNFPDAPTDGQKYADPGTGETWSYETATNSWTSDGLTTSSGVQYKGSLDFTQPPPATVNAGWQYSSSTSGTPNAGFTGLTGPIAKGDVVLYTGAGWTLLSHTVSDATTAVKGIVQLADAAAVTAGTAGRVVDAKELKDSQIFLQDGTDAKPRTYLSKLKDVVSVKDFGAKGDGVADDTAAIQAAITYAKTLKQPRLVLDAGSYLVSSTLNFDLPDYSTIESIGDIVTATGNPAVRIGSATVNHFGYRVTGLKVRRTTQDTSGGSAGVEIRNVVASYIDIRHVSRFQDGVLCLADQANGGVSYNEFHLGYLQDNRYNLHLREAGTGYVNENSFYGGNFNHDSGYPAVSTVNIWIDHAVYRNNNNRFYSPSLEDTSALGVAAIINGDSNLIVHPRMERTVDQQNYQIQFTATSADNQIIGSGFGMLYDTNVSDLGFSNSYETRIGAVIHKQTPAGAGNGVLKLRSVASGAARTLVCESTAGTATAYIQGDGFIYSYNRGYFQSGVRFSTSDLSYNDFGIYVGSGSPEGVVKADPGSLYMNKSGGAGTSLYVKESGGANTGWVAK